MARSKEAEAVGYVTNPIVILTIRDDELATEAEATSECHVRQLADLLEGVLAKLPEREALVIRLHYGAEPRNLAQIAKVMGISPGLGLYDGLLRHAHRPTPPSSQK